MAGRAREGDLPRPVALLSLPWARTPLAAWKLAWAHDRLHCNVGGFGPWPKKEALWTLSHDCAAAWHVSQSHPTQRRRPRRLNASAVVSRQTCAGHRHNSTRASAHVTACRHLMLCWFAKGARALRHGVGDRELISPRQRRYCRQGWAPVRGRLEGESVETGPYFLVSKERIMVVTLAFFALDRPMSAGQAVHLTTSSVIRRLHRKLLFSP